MDVPSCRDVAYLGDRPIILESEKHDRTMGEMIGRQLPLVAPLVGEFLNARNGDDSGV